MPISVDEEDEVQALDPEFLTSVLGSLPGVETSDPAVQEAMNSLSEQKDNGKGEEEGSDKKKS